MQHRHEKKPKNPNKPSHMRQELLTRGLEVDYKTERVKGQGGRGKGRRKNKNACVLKMQLRNVKLNVNLKCGMLLKGKTVGLGYNEEEKVEKKNCAIVQPLYVYSTRFIALHSYPSSISLKKIRKPVVVQPAPWQTRPFTTGGRYYPSSQRPLQYASAA